MAKDLLPRLKGDDRRDACVQVGIFDGSFRDSIAKLVELGKDLPKVNHFYYYDQIFNSWAGKKPTVLYDSLEDLPTSNMQIKSSLSSTMAKHKRTSTLR